MMKKAQKCRIRFNDMLYQYRTSPVAGKKESPIELLEQRRPRTNMPYLGKGNPRGEPKAKTHNYPIGIKVMYRGGPDPDSSYHGTWYPARVTSHLEEPRSYLLENNYSKLVRRTEQHIHPFFTPPRPNQRRSMIEDCGTPAKAASRRFQNRKIEPKRKLETNDHTERLSQKRSHEAGRWRERNLRPTPPRVNYYTDPGCPLPSPADLHETPDPELRRSSRILARRSSSDTD